MIVVDSNVVAYCWLNGPRTALAQRLRVADPDWHLPLLWRSELRSALAGYCRAGHLMWQEARRVMSAAEKAIEGREHLVPSSEVLATAETSSLSAYDCEFVSLARLLAVPLVTEDKAILRARPDVAVTMERYLASGGSMPRPPSA